MLYTDTKFDEQMLRHMAAHMPTETWTLISCLNKILRQSKTNLKVYQHWSIIKFLYKQASTIIELHAIPQAKPRAKELVYIIIKTPTLFPMVQMYEKY